MWRSPRVQFVAVSIALVALAGLVYGSYIADGGFVTDPWVVQGWYQFAPEHGLFELSKLYIEYNGIGVSRSLDFVRLAAQSEVLGSDATSWLAWQVAMCVLMSMSIFLLLRKLRLPVIHAAVIAALILIFPAATSIRIWPIMGSPAAITLTALGFLLALHGFEKRGARRLAFHGASVALFVSSAFLYEAAVPVMFFSGLLYRIRVPWRKALPRWGVDVFALSMVAGLLKANASVRGSQDLAGMLDHAATITDQALTLLTSVVLPLGGVNRWVVAALVAAIPIAAVVFAMRQPSTDLAERLRFWLWVLVAGLLVVALGYASFVPGDDYYEPLSPGIGNRVNAVPGIGFVLALYALAMLVSAMVLHRSPRGRSLVPIGALVACAVVAVSWLQSIARDEDSFVLAHAEGERVIHVVKEAIPDPAPGSTIWTFGQPMEVAPGVPIFDRWGNLASRIRLAYDDPTLNGQLGAPDTWFQCGRTGIVPHGPLYDGAVPSRQVGVFAYGRTYFVDTTTGRGELIRTPRACRRADAAYPRSPNLLGEAPSFAPALSSRTPHRIEADGTIAGPGNQSIPVLPGAVTGYVDFVDVEGGIVSLFGWAAVGNLTAPATQVIGMVDGNGVGETKPATERPDVADAYDEALGKSGFILLVKRSSLECSDGGAGLKVFGVAQGAGTELTFVGDSREQLNAAC